MSDTAQLSEAKRLLLQKMLAGGNAPRAESVPSVTPRTPGTAAPISAEQMNVWVHASMAQDVPLYNEAVTIHRCGPLDIVSGRKKTTSVKLAARSAAQFKNIAPGAIAVPCTRCSRR